MCKGLLVITAVAFFFFLLLNMCVYTFFCQLHFDGKISVSCAGQSMHSFCQAGARGEVTEWGRVPLTMGPGAFPWSDVLRGSLSKGHMLLVCPCMDQSCLPLAGGASGLPRWCVNVGGQALPGGSFPALAEGP